MSKNTNTLEWASQIQSELNKLIENEINRIVKDVSENYKTSISIIDLRFNSTNGIKDSVKISLDTGCIM